MEYCRLCAELKDLCDIAASIDDVEQKLRSCCQWTTGNTEYRFPYNVCSICLDKLDKCWLFSQSVQLAQQRLLDIFENGTETEVEIEMKFLPTKVEQIDNDFLDYSNDFSAPQSDFNPVPSPERKQNARMTDPIELNEEETKKVDGIQFKCPDCEKCFKRKWYLTEHMTSHSEERPFVCSFCLRKFKSTANLQKHSKRRSKTKCENCLREFCSVAELSGHKQLECKFGQNQNEPKTDQFNQNKQQIGGRIDQPMIGPGLLQEKFRSSIKCFKCDICGRVFNNNDNMKQHRKTHSDERPFECWLCHKKVRTKGHMKRHMKIHTIFPEVRRSFDEAKKRAKFIELYGDGEPIDLNKLKLECPKCNKHFVRVSKLKEHCATHLIDRPFECTLCHKTFKSMKALRSHMMVHLCPSKYVSPTDSNWICDQCGKAYKHKISLNEHVQSAHSDERKFNCDMCDGRFKTMRQLKEHHRVRHTNRRLQCKKCDASFKYKVQLYLHTKRHDGPLPKLHSCDLCGKAFREKRAVTAHRRIHTGETPEKTHKCNYCGKYFSRNDNLKDHIYQVHGISKNLQNSENSATEQMLPPPEPSLAFKCEICGLGYKSHKILKIHMKSHTEFEHKCTQCDRKFRKPHSLKLHMETHTGVINKPNVCDICGKGFRKNTELRDHRRIHTGEKPFTCEHCASNFRTMSSFYSHLKKTHGISVSARNKEERIRATTLATVTSTAADQQSQSTN